MARILVEVLLSGMVLSGPVPDDVADADFFESKVRPILVARCVECHGPAKQKGGLRLDSSAAMQKGGDGGPIVAPGNPDESGLIEAIRYEGDTRMPPKGKMADAEIAIISDWVKRGAAWPTTPAIEASAEAKASPGREFWAFQPIADPGPPDGPEALSAIDRFVQARLQAAGLAPAPRAERSALIRRVTFDLIGLPPTPDEVNAFVEDESPEAFARVVDRLLASPRYGERWGRHWLDLARYGEDQAHSFQPRLYPQGWRYRDWVINALNNDMPYDRFLMEQVAGDLIDEPGRAERLPALGFFALGPVYYGDPKKLDQYDDRIDTLCRGVLGLTVACARCHDHKYDPISQKDYYGLAGVIASSEYKESPLVEDSVVREYQQGQEAIKQQNDKIDARLLSEADRLVAWKAGKLARYFLASWALRKDGAEAASIAEAYGLEPRRLTNFRTFLNGVGKDRPYLADWKALTARKNEPGSAELAHAAQAFQEKALQHLAYRSDEVRRQGAKGRTAAPEGPDKELLADLFADKAPFGVAKDKVEGELAPDRRAELAAMRSELDRLKKTAPPMYPFAHALSEGKASTQKVLQRGNPASPGDEAPRRFLEVLGGTACETGSGRLDLAKAITSPDNPLTARVMVNRVWRHHFGRGLVGTPGNFGQLGERPSHPELLDWLSSRFIESVWSLKALHRLILLSETYQQATTADPKAREIDPENRFLSHANRRRLEVEAWRDSLLAASGRLDLTPGGPSFALDQGNPTRRTVYAAVSRHELSPLLRLFDFPDPNITGPSRGETTVPLQQLFVLNDDLVIGSAKNLAESLQAAASTEESRIDLAYQRLFARMPTDEERRIGLDYLKAVDPEPSNGPGRWQRYAQALLGCNEFTYLD
ncbi:MAG: PSD1 and planctomycete cytochrome C domain-containing protein [Isosphaeraceae bacterium]